MTYLYKARPPPFGGGRALCGAFSCREALRLAPVAPHRCRAARRRERSGDDVEAPVERAAVAQLDPGVDHRDGGEPGKADLAREAALAREPGDLARDNTPAGLHTAMVFVDLHHGLDLIRLGALIEG